ncbi:DNA repair protein RadC [Virgibacillus salarius]|uniref:JAB domain-containing protein n=1 Tax=Virgibacillus salarius TaxID=447199 RepID=UPI002490994E|nr:DNA repair protein RadC [Virgibacillus salarius]WBX81507.1 DNA repair protein RadC [Virgibacillus salarius]
MASAKRVNIVSVKLVKENSLLYKKRSIRSPEDGYDLVKSFLEDKDRENFIVVALDTKNQPVSINVCHIGSLNASLVSPREIMKTAILSSAASIIVAHNHPSGDTQESREDIEVTKRLTEAGKLMGIELLDHLIIGDGKYASLKEKGYI